MWIYARNNAKVEIKGLATCKLSLRGGRDLILHDVLLAPQIRQNIIFVLFLLNFGFSLNFHDNLVKLYSGTTFYGSGFVNDGFIVMDFDFNWFNSNNGYSLFYFFTLFR